ncbi:ribose-5-phosphate isomerase [Auriculariales sp. MPI-PUGE-AT-0066]|nr:ribose-5-phosphate isomerase [Auriculariales sp. MPI-PUGE-AT-0066]
MTTSVSAIETAKKLAAFTAVDRHVLSNHHVIGIGSGSTVPYVVERIVQQGRDVNESRVFIPTGFQSKKLIVDAGLVLGDVEQYPAIDITIDGADEIDAELNCIKGGGGCQYREKVLAEAAETFIIVADYRKRSSTLGTNWKNGVPIEVVPFGYARVLRQIKALGARDDVDLRMAGAAKAGPVVSDNGNFLLDAVFEQHKMAQPLKLLRELKSITGVVEVGLFCGLAKRAYYGNADGSVTVHSEDGKYEEIAAQMLPS